MPRAGIACLILIALLGNDAAAVDGRQGAQARSSGSAYASSISMTDWQFPDGTTFGGASSGSGADGDIGPALVESLWGYDPTSHYYADLATEIPTQANGGIRFVGDREVITIHRKHGQRWSDGSPITDADYVFQLLMNYAPEVNLTFGDEDLQSVTFSGDDMILRLAHPYAPALDNTVPIAYPLEYFERKYGITLPASLTTGFDVARMVAYFHARAYQGSPLQRLLTAWFSDPYNSPHDIFDGPYTIGEWDQDQRITLIPNPYYTALPPDPRHPRPAKIVFVSLSENEGAYLLDLTARSTYDNIDEALGVAQYDLPAAARSRYRVLTTSAPGFGFLALNQANPALRDIRVRQALQYAIDKQGYLHAEFPFMRADQAARLNQTTMIPAVSPWSISDQLPQNLYNPAKARALLAAAGYAATPGGGGRRLTLTMYVYAGHEEERSALLLQRYWLAIGVSVKLYFPPISGANGLFSSYQDGGILSHRRFDIAHIGYINLAPDPDYLLSFFGPGRIPDATHPFSPNVAGIQDPAMDALLLRARHAGATGERAALYAQFQRYFLQQAYAIPLFSYQNIVLVKDTIGNLRPNPYGNEWNTWQWWDRKAA